MAQSKDLRLLINGLKRIAESVVKVQQEESKILLKDNPVLPAVEKIQNEVNNLLDKTIFQNQTKSVIDSVSEDADRILNSVGVDADRILNSVGVDTDQILNEIQSRTYSITENINPNIFGGNIKSPVSSSELDFEEFQTYNGFNESDGVILEDIYPSENTSHEPVDTFSFDSPFDIPSGIEEFDFEVESSGSTNNTNELKDNILGSDQIRKFQTFSKYHNLWFYNSLRPSILGQKYLFRNVTAHAADNTQFIQSQDDTKRKKASVFSSASAFGASKKGAPKPRKKPIGNFEQKLSSVAQESKVPGSRISRLVSFGGLGAGLAAGAISEIAKKGLGIKDTSKLSGKSALDDNPFLSEANAERIVNTLCRVRGAALKLGQIISIQDEALISPQMQKIFERVRQSADYMPQWQLEKTLVKELGSEWRSNFSSFDMQPFAAASIGQVHQGTLLDGREVAVKLQYPGVADSIDSDLRNLTTLLSVGNIIPKGLFLEEIVDVARIELTWECDYYREAKFGKKFREILKDHPFFYVPEVIEPLCTKSVLTTELVNGQPIDKLSDLSQEERNEISLNILHLTLEEVFVHRVMQTDPNWSNFLYDRGSGRISLLDFGSTREFPKSFVDEYMKLIYAASINDRETVLNSSIKIGFLSGYEAKVMNEAHVDSVMILGESFQKDEKFDFANQTTSSRIHNLVPTLLSHRLRAPPEEIYSLHRKMAGVFLLCSKLEADINCRTLFENVHMKYKEQSQDIVINE